ncbi:transcription factor [Beauveria asiatica]|uniref:Transcription factor n=1 Tax=Beauveria asiatica TaxID=1069075 RepID=A0AAW0S4T4_9HYPO
MPPSTKRAQRGRRDLRLGRDARTISSTDAEMDPSSSPTRPAKRRKKAASPESDRRSSNLDNDHAPPTDDDQIVSQVTQQLKSQAVQASKDHANAIHEANGDGVKAYAKVAAQDWTFYITKLAVNIGRAPEVAQGAEQEAEDQDHVHIDLGPSKMVSRAHAAIVFDSKDEKWLLQVKGRNGARIDGQSLKPRVSHPLTSGEVIEIGNVEMMFVLPSEISPLHVHPSFLQRCGLADDIPSSRRPPAIAPAPVNYKRPGTPPSTRRIDIKSPAVSTPAVIIGASGVDLSLDDNQHIKPQYSYAQMITQAILNAPDEKLNLNGIYTYIMDTYSYYRNQQAAGWQNSIRHNLSLNKSFDKVARSTDEPGKGMKWQIVSEAREEMVRNAYKVGRGGHRGSSAPSSPNQLNYITQGPKDMAGRDTPTGRKRRASPLTSPVPRSSLRMSQSTPNRSDRPGLNATLTADGSPLPRQRKTMDAESSFAGYQPQSPTLTSSYQDDNSAFVTPAPPRIHPRLAPPSTAQRPSQHMPTSSPAPFWSLRESVKDERTNAASEQQPAADGQIPPQQPNEAATASTKNGGGAKYSRGGRGRLRFDQVRWVYDTVRSKVYNFGSLEHRNGRLAAIQDFGGVKKYGYNGMRNRYVLIDELVAALAKTRRGGGIRCQIFLVEKDTPKGVSFALTDGRCIEKLLLVRADGIQSTDHMHLWPDFATTFTGMAGITTAVATAQLQLPAGYHGPVTIVTLQSALVIALQQGDGLEVLIGKKMQLATDER